MESGQYKQGKGLLKTVGNKFCCLGVASELFWNEAGTTGWILAAKGDCYSIGDINNDDRLSPNITEFLGLYSDVGSSNGSSPSLAYLNDDGKTFAEIVAIIKKDPSVYFSEPK